MSGGHFDYKDFELSEIIDILERDKAPEKLIKLVKSVMNILHAYDWWKSGDDDEGNFKKSFYNEIQKIKEILKDGRK